MNNTEKMLETLAAKIGMDAKTLKEAVEKGDMNMILANLSEADKKKFKAFLDNPEFLRKLWKSSQN